jgi:trehalose/maltose hydrolase-like predicted phosphorylase
VPAERRLSLGVADAELKRWEHLSRRMYLAFSPDGLISQFDGVEALPQLDPEQFGKANVQWELEAEGRDANDYQIFKQADFAMLLYLFGPDELLRLFKRLDYEVGTAQLHRSLDHYRKLTTHNSSLSEVSYAAGLAFFDVEASWQIWRSSLGPDLDPAHAEGTAEGLHLGAMAASLDVLQRRYLGLVADWDGLRLEPLIPRQLPPLSLGFVYRNGRFRLTWDGLSLKMSACHENLSWLTFRHRGRKLTNPPGTVLELEVTELA